jgi:hypothetical protein
MKRSVLLLPLGVVLIIGASGCGAGETVGGGDCTGATFGANGGCVAPSHGPPAAQRAAEHHFGVQTVECVSHGRITLSDRKIHAWGCKPIKKGSLQDNIYCVFLEDGAVLTSSEIAALPKSKRSCL